MEDAIKVDHLFRKFGEIQALSGVSLEVKKGELFGLIGPDGAGKSTLYKILATLLNPDAGDARISGLDVVKEYKKVRTRIGYMPERFSLYPDLSVQENLEFFASLFGVSIRTNYDLIAPIYGQLSHFPDRRAGNLSGGMKQKLALSCALIHRPEILLLDEPTTGVDAVSRSEFWDILKQMKAKGITVMVSTSYMDEASLCDRISMIYQGKILATGTSEELVLSSDETIYNASAEDMFHLLETLRKMPGVKDCYTFGASLHVVTSPGFDPEAIRRNLLDEGLKDVKLYPGKPDFEDLFIKLTEKYGEK